jgi:hypothetical protein
MWAHVLCVWRYDGDLWVVVPVVFFDNGGGPWLSWVPFQPRESRLACPCRWCVRVVGERLPTVNDGRVAVLVRARSSTIASRQFLWHSVPLLVATSLSSSSAYPRATFLMCSISGHWCSSPKGVCVAKSWTCSGSYSSGIDISVHPSSK